MTFNEFLEKLNLDEKNYNREIEWNSNYHKQFKIKNFRLKTLLKRLQFGPLLAYRSPDLTAYSCK
jgi:hypothetical protein